MSGIVGIVNFDGAPIDRALLSRMTAFMDFRGPDARRTWIAEPTHESGIDPCVGFGHTLLRTTYEAEHEQQPFTLDGNTWIVADCRVDAREELIVKLQQKGRSVSSWPLAPGPSPLSLHRPDAELILHAWHVWGEECVEHLLGDFAFAIWDAPRRRLFCARDHMGVKPFYYAHIGSTMIFSNTLDCVRLHPAVSDELNDLAIADFLLFDLNQDQQTTSFADIQRIPPAHRITWSSDGMRINRYWTLPIDEPIYFKRSEDYTDRFKQLLEVAVGDRLRTHKVGVFMSGGLDSPALAATACKLQRNLSSNCEVLAFNTVIDGIDQNEGYYAGLVAKHLGIPIHFQNRSGDVIDPNWSEAALRTPEPVMDPTYLAGLRQEYQTVSRHTRVVFYGEGPDNALHYDWRSYLRYLLSKRKFGRLATDIAGHAIRHRRIPLVPTIPRMLRERAVRHRWQVSFPGWLAQSFECGMKLRSRWETGGEYLSGIPHHPLRSWGYQSFYMPIWQVLFANLDPAATRMPLEARHPFLDVRLLRYMLAIPALPWCREKYIVRRSMRGTLPDAILRRPKSPLTSDPGWVGGRRFGLPRLTTPQLCRYIDLDRVPKRAGSDMVSFRVNFRPFALDYWLRNVSTITEEPIEEALREQFIAEEVL